MSNYRVFVGSRKYDITVMKDHLLVNGDPFSIDMESLNGNGLHVLRHPNRNIEAYLESSSGGCYQVQIDGEHINAEVNIGLNKEQHVEAAGDDHLQAPMPGLIIDVLVEAGDEVQEGDTLVVQEAMKMQMKLRAPRTGTVKAVHTEPGSQVEKNERLISLDSNDR